MPTVTVFIVPRTSHEARTMMECVRQQTFDDWEGVVVDASCKGSKGSSGRWRVVSDAGDDTLGAVSDEIARCDSEFVLILEAGTRLRPTALESLVREARGSSADAVYGAYRFVCGIGELPADEACDTRGALGEEEWSRCKAAPLGVQLLRRTAVEMERFAVSNGEAAGWEWCLRLARAGVRWTQCEEVVAEMELRPPASPEQVLASIEQHVKVASLVAVTTGGDAETAETTSVSALNEAAARMRQRMKHTSMRDGLLTAGMPMRWLYTEWWYRQGFTGTGPERLLNNQSGPAPERVVVSRERRPVDVFVATFGRPERLSAMIESVRGTGYPARVCIAAGDIESVRVCERYLGLVECVFSTEANRRTGCTAPLNHVVRSLVRHDAIFCTDDCVFAPDAIDVAMASMDAAYPDGDGVVGLAQDNIPDGYDLAFPLIGKRFRERFTSRGDGSGGGDLFFPGFFHMYNDAEIGITIKCIGKWHFEPRANLRHFHPCTGAPEDLTHTRGRTHIASDVQLWHQRRASGMVWGVDA